MFAGGFRVVGLCVFAADGTVVSGCVFSMGKGAADWIVRVVGLRGVAVDGTLGDRAMFKLSLTGWEEVVGDGGFVVVGLRVGAAVGGTLVRGTLFSIVIVGIAVRLVKRL